MSQLSFVLFFCCLVLFWHELIVVSAVEDYVVEDIEVPSECESVASTGDHLLLEYSVFFRNGTAGAYVKRPSQLVHVLLDSKEESPILSSLKGMCRHAVRQITWTDGSKINLLPIFVKDPFMSNPEDGVSIRLTVDSITTATDYQIFSSLREGNITQALDLIDSHIGVNALDEWGQTPLIIAVQMNRMEVIAALLNTRMPKVDVNAAKSSGYTALHYAIEKSSPSIVAGLLRRGADPNAQTLQEGSKGNTPLHFACLFEKTKHAELLLEFGAIPNALNQHGKTPLQLVPADAVRSTKVFFKKMIEDAEKKLKSAQDAEKHESVVHTVISNSRNDL